MKTPAWLADDAGAHSWRHVAWLGAVVVAAIVGLAVFDTVRGYDAAVAATGRELEGQAIVFAEQTARSIQAVDVVLRHLAEQDRNGALRTRSSAELHELLREQAVGLVQANGLSLHDAAGNTLALSWRATPQPEIANIADVPGFDIVRESDGTVVGEALKSRVGDEEFFPIARRLTTPSGRFAGVVAARGRISYFQNFYRDAARDPGTAVSLLHREGTLLARYPEARAALGKRFPVVAEMLAAAAKGNGPARAVSPIDGVDRFGAVAAVPDYPLVVTVTRDAAAALGPWRAQTLRSGLRTLVLAGLALALLHLVLRSLRRLDTARASLAASKERFALAAAGADDGIWDWDLVAGTAFESARARELQGLPPGPETQPLAELQASLMVHPDDAARRAETMQAHLDGRTPAYEVEYRVRHRDGAYRWIRVRALCIRDGDGRPCRIAGSVSDVDDRKRAEVALRQSEDRFAVAVAGSDDGIWDWDYVGGRAFASRRAREINGMAEGPEEQTIASWFTQMEERLHPEDVARRQAALDDHLAGRAPAYEGDFRVRNADGSYRWIHVHGMCQRDASGTPLRMAGSVGDIDARKRAEEALRVSEERYAIAMTGSHEGHWVWDIHSNQVYVSERLAEIFDLDKEQRMTTLNEFFAKVPILRDDYARVEQAVREHIAGATPRLDIEYRIVRDGEIRWVLNRAKCFRDANGRAERMAGATVDVTERHHAEAALRESEERFALAVAGSNDGVLDWDIANDRMFTSERAMQIAGVVSDRQVHTRAEWTRLLQLHPDDVERHGEDFRRHLAGESEVRVGDYRLRHPDGVYRWVRVRGRSVRHKDGRAIRWAGSVSDIDAQKRTEEALRRSEERYQLAVEGSNEGLWDWDLASDLLFLSPRAQDILWLEPCEPLQSRRFWIDRTPYHPDDVALVRRAISDHLRGITPHFAIEYRLRHHSGEWRWYRQRGVALRDASGKPYRMAGSMENISARKDAEAERDRLELQLRQAQKLEAIGTLAGGIAHDFNNILSAILGYGELAQKDAREGTALRRNVDAALAAGMRAKSLVERILAFSRSGMAERVPVHVQSVVDEALDAVAASLPASVKLVRHVVAGDAAVLGDPTQLHQVVMNLCANAVQAMRAAGPLEVTVDVCTLASTLPVATSTLAPGRYVRLAVRDSGSGIAPHVLERIFDPFFTTKEVGVGTGLGLSLVHGIVTDLGGGIAVESRQGAGSTFTVYVPSRSWVGAPAVVEERVARGDGETILLVDDEEALVRLGEETLAELGYEPVGFSSSAAALATFRGEPDRFHAVLSDESMPGLTGSELVREIRRIRPDVPIVLMSGYVSAGLLARARDAGVAEVLAKPLVARDIARSLASALRGAAHLHGAAR